MSREKWEQAVEELMRPASLRPYVGKVMVPNDAILYASRRIAALEKALRPFANYACKLDEDEGDTCDCHNCIAKATLNDSEER